MIPLLAVGAVAFLIDELEKRDGKKRYAVPVQCAWCKKFMPSKDVSETPNPPTSHGMCPACVEKERKKAGLE